LILCALMNLTISAPSIKLSISMLFRILHTLPVLTGTNIFLNLAPLYLSPVRHYPLRSADWRSVIENCVHLVRLLPFESRPGCVSYLSSGLQC
jgi:hypothetical protein